MRSRMYACGPLPPTTASAGQLAPVGSVSWPAGASASASANRAAARAMAAALTVTTRPDPADRRLFVPANGSPADACSGRGWAGCGLGSAQLTKVHPSRSPAGLQPQAAAACSSRRHSKLQAGLRFHRREAAGARCSQLGLGWGRGWLLGSGCGLGCGLLGGLLGALGGGVHPAGCCWW